MYESKQRILEEAGFSHPVLGELLAGTADGTNDVFTTAQKPLSDGNYDDAVDVTDVTAYVNGVPVSVASLNATTGALTLTVAPAAGAVVTGDYVYSPITDVRVTEVRQDAQGMIDEQMASIDVVPYSVVPATIRKITRWYAAGLLLVPDYGSGIDIDQTSKDGYKRMATAEAWLAKYLAMGGQTGGSPTPDAEADAQSDAPLFGTSDVATSLTPVDDSFLLDIGCTD